MQLTVPKYAGNDKSIGETDIKGKYDSSKDHKNCKLQMRLMKAIVSPVKAMHSAVPYCSLNRPVDSSLVIRRHIIKTGS